MTIFGVSTQVLFGQLLLGLINGAFYAMLSLGVAVIFGLLHIINFAHGAFYMLGAFVAFLLLSAFGIGYWPALIIAPACVAALALVVERLLLRRIAGLDNLYSFLLTYGLAIALEAGFRIQFGSTGRPYAIPQALQGGVNIGFMFLHYYRAWVIAASIILCVAIWLVIEKTKLGSYLRAATENAPLVRTFGIKVPFLLTATYALGAALAGVAGVLAAPIYQVSPLMGTNIIAIVFAVVVIGGMGSIAGAIIAGFGLGIVEGLTKVFYPEASSTIIFVVMVLVLLVKPAGLFGNPAAGGKMGGGAADDGSGQDLDPRWYIVLLASGLIAPAFIFPLFLTKALCFALFACAFNLLLGYGGMLSFGHAAFFGIGGYAAATALRTVGSSAEIALVAAALAATLLGIVFGWLAIKRSGIYFAMITLALAQMTYFAALQIPGLGGDDGLPTGTPILFLATVDVTRPVAGYFFTLAVASLAFLFVHRVVHSPFGQIVKAIRDNEPRVLSLGYSASQYRLALFAMSAGLSGIAGALKAFAFQAASLHDLFWTTSGVVVLITLVGGLGTLAGPVVGAVLITMLESYLSEYGAWIGIIEGAIFVAAVVALRRGLVGSLLQVYRRPKLAAPVARPA